jgi:hypothetical protein
MSRLIFAAVTATLMSAVSARAAEPISLRDMGSFHVGGRLVEISGKPVKEIVFTPGGVPAKVDPNGTYQVEQMYVQYFLPSNEHGAYPLLMWHGGGLTGVTWETTPDGREGWLNFFLRKGWSVYNSDAVERGRAGWAQYPDIFKSEPVFLTTANPFLRFRIGDGPNSWDPDPARRKTLPGSLFPTEAYDNFVKQGVPRWTTNDEATIAAYIAEVDRIGPCIIMVHSQAGSFGFKVAQAPRQGQGADRRRAGRRRRPHKDRCTEEHPDPDHLWRLHRARYPLAQNARHGPRVCGKHQGRRRQCRCRRPAADRHQGQFAHDHDGQEQRRGCEPDPELAGRQRSDEVDENTNMRGMHGKRPQFRPPFLTWGDDGVQSDPYLSSLRTQGPITTGRCGEIKRAGAHLAILTSPGVWVPAFAGTTLQRSGAA